jgi:hypothetical protein
MNFPIRQHSLPSGLACALFLPSIDENVAINWLEPYKFSLFTVVIDFRGL